MTDYHQYARYWDWGPVYTNTCHIVFIETASFSLRFHLGSARKRSKTMIVFTENDNFWKRSPKWKDIVIMISLSCRWIVFTENVNFWKRCNNNKKLFKWFLPSSLVFIVFVWTVEKDTKTMCKCNTIVAFSLKIISFSMKTYSCRPVLRDEKRLFEATLHVFWRKFFTVIFV